jgi:hypothetical protein
LQLLIRVLRALTDCRIRRKPTSLLFVVAAVVALVADAVIFVRSLPEFARFVVTPRDIDLVEGCSNLLCACQHVTGTRRGRLMIFEFSSSLRHRWGVGCLRVWIWCVCVSAAFDISDNADFGSPQPIPETK